MYLRREVIKAREAEIAQFERDRDECERVGDDFGAAHCQDIIDRLKSQIADLELKGVS